MKFKEPKTVQELANILGCTFKGDPNHLVLGLNEIHSVAEGDLTFTDIEKYYNRSLNSLATTILINKDIEAPEGKALLISDNPFSDYNKLIKAFLDPEPPASQWNEQYRIYTGYDVDIGEGTVIYPGVVIGNHVRIGKNCTIFPGTVIYDQSYIGNEVIIQANVVIGGHGFYFKNRKTHWEKLLSCGRTIIEDDVEIGACCTIDKGISDATILKKGCKLDNHIHVGHCAVIGERVLIAAQAGIGGTTTIEEDVIIWGQVGITKDVVIGKGAMILAQSGVSKSLEGGKVYFGYPADENRKTLKEMANIRKIDSILQRLNQLEHKDEPFLD